MQFTTHTYEETEQLGMRLAEKLCGGEVIAFTGGLGAGKTAFTRGLARGLEIADVITSPTFTVVNEYDDGRLPLFHFDMYRLTSSEDLYDIGWEEYLDRGGVCAVEWSEIVADALDKAVIRVDISRVDDNTRSIVITGIEI